jgi:hypothetical protein
MGLSQIFSGLRIGEADVGFCSWVRSVAVILNAIAEKLKRQSRDDFKGGHFEAWLIMQAVTWHLRYPLSYRDWKACSWKACSWNAASRLIIAR